MTRRRAPQPPAPLPSERRGSAPVGEWLARGGPAAPTSVVWLIRPMPDGQWPTDMMAPRDDSFNWLVRSHCGHEGGLKLWAFYERRYAEMYEGVCTDVPPVRRK